MASSYKTLGTEDVTVTRTPLYENIPINETMVTTADHIKTFSHRMFQSVYDYNYTLASANHLFDVSFGVSPESSASLTYTSDLSQKKNTYTQMSQVLNGYDTDNIVKTFSRDASTPFNHMFFLSFSRLLVKDEIRKGSFELELGVESVYTDRMDKTILIKDSSTATNSGPTGEWSYLYATNGTVAPLQTNNVIVGVIFYQAGIVALASWIFAKFDASKDELGVSAGTNLHQHKHGILSSGINYVNLDSAGAGLTTYILEKPITDGTLATNTSLANVLRNRIVSITFHNTTELNSTIYFCRINGNEYNYSANPTFVDSNGKIVVKEVLADSTSTYITTVGLYSSDNELLAVGKLSEPIKKTADQSLILRVRLDV